MTKVALVQRAPVLLDRAATLEHAVTWTDEAASAGATLIIFPEAFIPGYPAWIWALKPGDDARLIHDLHARLISQAIDLNADDLAPLRAAARRSRATVVCGIHEHDSTYSRGTLYNTAVVISPDGKILNRHRKLMPTNAERTVWGLGDASGLRVVPTPAGRVATSICWENYMPLARFALYAQGVELYVAPTWDEGDGWLASMQHIAREGRCWVLGCGCALQGRDVPENFPGRDKLVSDEDEWINDGDSVAVDPLGKIVAGPLRREHGILYADCDPTTVAAARRTLDVAGHYGRPDIFKLEVNRAAPVPAHFADGAGMNPRSGE